MICPGQPTKRARKAKGTKRKIHCWDVQGIQPAKLHVAAIQGVSSQRQCWACLFFFHVANKLVVIHSGLMGDLNPFGCSDKSCRQKMTFYRRSECVSAECNGHMNVHMKALRGRVFMIKWTFAASYQLSIRRCCRHTRWSSPHCSHGSKTETFRR